ncbi:hypothetical protein [Stappia sp.]|uniref:hypothetical protein n=1 Tax=Stappia sp. TaxID=1870903 RepID=UPI003A997B58
MAIGFLVTASGFGLLAIAAGEAGLQSFVVGYCVFSLGLAPVFTLTTDVIVGSVPPTQAGAVAGLSEASSELGGAFGIAVPGSLTTALYRIGLGDALQVAALLCGTLALADTALTLFIRNRTSTRQTREDTP